MVPHIHVSANTIYKVYLTNKMYSIHTNVKERRICKSSLAAIHLKYYCITHLHGIIQKERMIITFKFHLLFPSWSLGEDEKALPSMSHAYSTDSVLPKAISCQNCSSMYLAGRHPELEYLRANTLLAIFSKSRKVYFLKWHADSHIVQNIKIE